MVIVVFFLAAITWAGWHWLRSIAGLRERIPDDSRRRLDVYAGSPYQNTRPGVRYVGDAACVRCHREIAEAYSSHPMGRSLTLVDGAYEGPPSGAATGLPVEAHGVQYVVERRDGRHFHKAWRRDAGGAVFAHIEAEVRYALGSGTRGIAFLIERDGFLFQSPIAWFAQQRRWEISAGYGEFETQPDFERPIQPGCLFCHANQFRPVAGTLNRYETPIFQGHAIGCERCHGPGGLHVDQGGLMAGSDLTIVNPVNLAPALRESVCQQCHLQGSFRFARAGREPLDFRPGLPLHQFLAIFLMKKGNRERFEAVGHVEQMESSRCFLASKGRLGCTSCHDPHRLPARATKQEYFRGRCLECHNQRGCALPADQRQARGPGEDCIACHMPRLAVTNIPHTAATDHRIPRGMPGSEPQGPRVAPGQPAEIPLMDYHWALMTRAERRDVARDLGLALTLAAEIMKPAPQLARTAATQARPLLEAAVRDHPEDQAARDSLGLVLETLGKGEEALRTYQYVLRSEPGRESTLRAAGSLLVRLNRPELARSVLRSAIALDPSRSKYHATMAQANAQSGDLPGAIRSCREAIRLNPELLFARSLLVQCYLRSHQPDEADAAFQTLLQFYPASREVWEQWYERQKQAGSLEVNFTTGWEP
jgi:Flp pilus assembly protein TadD